MAQIIIPTPLRKFTDNAATIMVEALTVGAGLLELTTKYPQIRHHLFDEKGTVRSFVNVFVEDEDIRSLQQQNTPVQDATVISIVPAIAGGSIE